MVNLDEHQKPLETIWRVPDALWNKLSAILAEHDPPKPTGRKRIDARAAQGRNHLPVTQWVSVESTA